MVVKKQGFCTTLTFVITRADANGVDPAPIALGLRVHLWVAIHLASGRLEYAGLGTLGKSKHVDGAVHAGFGGLHWIVLVMHGRRRASQVVDLVYLHIQWKGDVMPHQLEVWVVQ